MRVNDPHLTQNQAAQSGKAPGTEELERASASRSAETRLGGNADRVELSHLTGGLARALAEGSRERTSRVQQLTQAVAEGSYQTDPRAMARAILAELRSAGHEQAPLS